MTARHTCPSSADLEKLMVGQMSEPEVELLAEHLEHCPRCVETVRGLRLNDTLLDAARRCPESDDPGETAVEQLIQRLKGLQGQAHAPVQEPTLAPGSHIPLPLPPPPRPAPAGLPAGKATEESEPFLGTAQGPDEIGRLGGYRVLKRLGAGGMGIVYQAEDARLQRTIALKVMKPDVARNPTARERFLREARAAARVKSDHVVHIYQVGEDGGVPFLAMEFLEGASLDDWLKKGGGPTPEQAVRIGREIALGLAEAHACGLIHRDVKPANVWLDSRQQGRVKLLDFGLARGCADGDPHLTDSGAIVGTPAYMSPEQGRGRPVDHRSDLFSLGVVLYRLTTGRLPFRGDNTMSLLASLAVDTPPPPREINPELPPGLAALIERLLAKDPEQRPATAREVAEALGALDLRQPSGPETAPGPAPRRPGRLLPWAVLAGALLVVLLAGVLVLHLGAGEGTVVIETVDPNVEMVFKNGDREIIVRDKKTGDEVTLPLGTYRGELKGGKDGLKLETDQFTLKRGERELVRVTWQAGDRPAAPGADVPPPLQVPEPPPLAEWLKGRKVLTVSQDGRGQYKTIQAALNALKPHEVVQVLDRGPYRERLFLSPVPDDAGLVSEERTVLELPEWHIGDRGDPEGHGFLSAEGFRIHGFALAFPETRSKRMGFALSLPNSSGVVLENCFFRTAENGEEIKAVIMGWYAEEEVRPVWLRDCLIRGAVALTPRNRKVVVVVERNYFQGTGAQPVYVDGVPGTVVVRHNVFDGWVGTSDIAFRALKEVGALEVANNTLTSPWPLDFVEGMPRKNVMICNNLRTRPGLVVRGQVEDKDVPDVLRDWGLGHNSYPRGLRAAELVPFNRREVLARTPTDVVAEPKFLSLDPQHPDYLRLPADSPLAKGGAGGEWPSYVGALPPGPAPKEGDWFTRLRQRWRDLNRRP
jgi:hypothetical protein